MNALRPTLSADFRQRGKGSVFKHGFIPKLR
jgi:hypothetical protein